MAVIGMIGPHAVGKTTAALRWLGKYGDRLTVAVADNQYEQTGSQPRVRVKEWKGTKEEKSGRAIIHRASNRTVLVESARGFSTWLEVFSPTDPVVIITSPEACGRRFLEERRAARGKPAELGAYWTIRRLDYECNGHLLNYVNKKLDPKQVHHFVIEDRDRDWPAVDECFYRLFRETHNRLLKGG